VTPLRACRAFFIDIGLCSGDNHLLSLISLMPTNAKESMDTKERWVDVDQVAAHLDVAKETVYRWIDKKEFPAHKAGRLLRFKLSDVDDWVRQGSGANGETEADKQGGQKG